MGTFFTLLCLKFLDKPAPYALDGLPKHSSREKAKIQQDDPLDLSVTQKGFKLVFEYDRKKQYSRIYWKFCVIQRPKPIFFCTIMSFGQSSHFRIELTALPRSSTRCVVVISSCAGRLKKHICVFYSTLSLRTISRTFLT